MEKIDENRFTNLETEKMVDEMEIFHSTNFPLSEPYRTHYTLDENSILTSRRNPEIDSSFEFAERDISKRESLTHLPIDDFLKKLISNQ